MANRVGIELLPYVCRIVEVRGHVGPLGRSRRRTGDTPVKTFREIACDPGSPSQLIADLRQALRGRDAIDRRARVAIWGLQSSHRGLLLPPAAAEDLLALARREAQSDERRQAGAPNAPAFTSDGIVVGEIREGGRREVGYVSANPDEVKVRLQLLRDAGFEIDATLTPALVHAAFVRQRWPTAPDQVTAVLAVNARVTALTVLRGTVVLFARELPWGSETPRPEQTGPAAEAGTLAGKLASELKRSLVYVKQNRQIDVTHLLICGDTPDLRTLTGPLMRELNVEVETLDGLEGLDLAGLTEPVTEFRTKVAALRPALAIASEAALPVDLQPRATGLSVPVSRDMLRRVAAAAVIGCVVAASAWTVVSYEQKDTRARVQSVRREIARLEPEAQRQQEARQSVAAASAQFAALEAFASQGPRLALVLDAFRLAPSDLAMSSLRLTTSSAGTWPLRVDGQARSATPADAQASFSMFLKSISASTYLGAPTRSPEITVRIEATPLVDANRNRGTDSNASATALADTPPPSFVGTVLGFALNFEVNK